MSAGSNVGPFRGGWTHAVFYMSGTHPGIRDLLTLIRKREAMTSINYIKSLVGRGSSGHDDVLICNTMSMMSPLDMTIKQFIQTVAGGHLRILLGWYLCCSSCLLHWYYRVVMSILMTPNSCENSLISTSFSLFFIFFLGPNVFFYLGSCFCWF